MVTTRKQKPRQQQIRDAAARKKEAEAFQMRMGGATYPEIAKAVGYRNRQGAHNAVKRVLDGFQADIQEERELELQRLDRLQRAIWTAAIGGDLDAVKTALKIMERRARMQGFDKPVKIDITDELRAAAVRFGLDPDDVLKAATEIIAEAQQA